MSLDECKAKHSSSQFVLWQEYLKAEVNFFHREDYYLAQIAATIHRANTSNPSAIGIDDYLIPFEESKGDKKPLPRQVTRQTVKEEPILPDEIVFEEDEEVKEILVDEESLKKEKMSWFSALGMRDELLKLQTGEIK